MDSHASEEPNFLREPPQLVPACLAKPPTPLDSAAAQANLEAEADSEAQVNLKVQASTRVSYSRDERPMGSAYGSRRKLGVWATHPEESCRRSMRRLRGSDEHFSRIQPAALVWTHRQESRNSKRGTKLVGTSHWQQTSRSRRHDPDERVYMVGADCL